jgi:hypothetical protein
MALAVMRISASVCSLILGSRTLSRRISPIPWKTTAFIGRLLAVDGGEPDHRKWRAEIGL